MHLRELMKKALPILVSVLEKEARGWFLHFREKVIADLKAQNLSDYEVEKVISLLLFCFVSSSMNCLKWFVFGFLIFPPDLERC